MLCRYYFHQNLKDQKMSKWPNHFIFKKGQMAIMIPEKLEKKQESEREREMCTGEPLYSRTLYSRFRLFEIGLLSSVFAYFSIKYLAYLHFFLLKGQIIHKIYIKII